MECNTNDTQNDSNHSTLLSHYVFHVPEIEKIPIKERKTKTEEKENRKKEI